MATPYVSAAMLLAQPAGLAWNVVPTLTATGPEQQAQLAQECWKATSAIDRYCHQPLRATAVTETETGPGAPRVAVDRLSGVASLITRQWPVTEVAAVQVSPARSFPETWTLVPANQVRIARPVLVPAAGIPVTGPSGGNKISVAPGWITWMHGPRYWSVMTSTTSGYPHASLTQDAAADATTLHVDDVTGWNAIGAGWAYDSVATEPVLVSAAAATSPVQLPGVGGMVQAGPGTLTLSSPLQNAHAAGTVISAMPADLIRAAALQAAVQALEMIDAIATQSMSGQMAGSTGALASEVECILGDYRAII